MVKEAVSHSAKTEKDHPMRPRFSIDAIYLNIGNLHIRHDIVEQLQELLALNVTIKKLTIQPTIKPETSGPQLWRSAWAALLFTICGHPGASIKPGKPIEDLHLVQPSLSEQMYHAFCSVLVNATSLKKLTIDEDALKATTHTRWRWLTYALFSNASTTSVESIESLTTPLLLPSSDMNIASVANATYPQTQLVSDATTSHDVYLGTLHLDQGAVINLSSDSEDTLVVQQPNGLNFEIIRKDPTSTSIEILLPGFGIGTVERVASQEKRSRLSPRSETAGSISSLLNTSVPVHSKTKHISISECVNGVSQCASLLPAIGSRLVSIKVVADGGNEELVKTILDNCPHLRAFELSGVKLPSFRPFTDVYTVHNRHLVELVLSKWKLDDEESLVEFLDMLADPASIPAKRLEKLVLNDKSKADGVLNDESAPALARVIHLNWKLSYLQAYLPASISSTYESALEELRGEEYDEEEDDEREVIQSIPLRSKCALVSIFAECSSEQSYQRPATRILQFASESLVRHVAVKELSEDDEGGDDDDEDEGDY